MECPLWVISRRFSCLPKRSALGAKADIIQGVVECPLIAISGHAATTVRSPKFSKMGCFSTASLVFRTPRSSADPAASKYRLNHGEIMRVRKRTGFRNALLTRWPPFNRERTSCHSGPWDRAPGRDNAMTGPSTWPAGTSRASRRFVARPLERDWERRLTSAARPCR